MREYNYPQEKTEHITFVSYDGDFPNLCRGTLTLEINGETVVFGSGDRFWYSGGYLDSDYCAHEGSWDIVDEEIPEQYREYAEEIEAVFNYHVPYGCCGGCA